MGAERGGDSTDSLTRDPDVRPGPIDPVGRAPGLSLPLRLDVEHEGRKVKGFAQIYSNGRLHVAVRGLVLASGPAAGTNPVAKGRAIVVCDGAVAAMSSVVAFSRKGNATVNEKIALPAHCLAPVVFFAGVPAPGVQRWFAVTGW